MAKTVLLPIDPQEQNLIDAAMKQAITQAQERQAELHILTVVPGYNNPMVASYFPQNAMEQALDAVDEKLTEYIEKQVPKDILTQLHVKSGNPAKEIIKMAKKLNAEMIVIPSNKHGRIDQALIGSVASKVVERASCSVLVVRNV
ncbi:MAG: universal stress protein [Motiliproteus sp.]|nr:universal stress protein [Motiliproteus sp.]MCW9051303.1 universal stress protein [Motiliproteus sp.]